MSIMKKSLSRRSVLKGTGATVLAGTTAGLGAPFVHAADPITLRIAGTGVNQFKQLADKAK